MRTMMRITTVGLTLLGCVGCDQASKSTVRLRIALGESHSYMHDALRLMHAENPGAFLSLGASLPEHMRMVAFTWIVGLLSVASLLTALLAPRLGRWRVVALALIAAGGFGNWMDRITNDGRVTDFLNVGFGSLRTGIFNVADMALMVGVVVLFAARQAAPSSNHWRGP